MAQSRRDQVQAQSYVLGRLTSALVAGDPERSENPHRRTLFGVTCGVLIAALVVAGFAIYGYVRPGGSSAWRKPGTLVLEKETGSRYVYVDGQLRPVLNYASARLLFGKEPPRVSVSSRSLTTVNRGLPVGIVAAPDALPRPGALAGVGWAGCLVGDTEPGGPAQSGLVLTVTAQRTGEPLGQRAVVVQADSGEGAPNYLVWQGRRYRLGAAWMARVFGYDGPAERVDARWLDLVPAATNIEPAAVTRLGEQGPMVQGRRTRIGQLFVIRLAGAEDRYYVLLRDGFSPLTATGYAIVAADPATARAYPNREVAPIQVGPPALAEMPVSQRRLFPDGTPAVPPPVGVRGEGRSWCVRRDRTGAVEVVADVRPGGLVPPGRARSAIADSVRMAPGSGGLVTSGRPGQVAGGRTYLITDTGLRYPVPTAEAAEALGYGAEAMVVVPPEWLRLLPEGPALDPTTVRGA